jgi:hypothetical protein
MIDTNTVNQIAPLASSAPDAWNVVAVGVGVAVTHAYHTIVAGGGIKNIVRKLWNGEEKKS